MRCAPSSRATCTCIPTGRTAATRFAPWPRRRARSKLRMEPVAMTRRMVAAIANPHVDVLGHCTGRLLVGRGRPQSEFDADVVIEACRVFDTAIEVNCRPERLDPPKDILRKAV